MLEYHNFSLLTTKVEVERDKCDHVHSMSHMLVEHVATLHTATNALQALGRGFDVNFDTMLLYYKGISGSRVVEIDLEHPRDLLLYDDVVIPNVSRDIRSIEELQGRQSSRKTVAMEKKNEMADPCQENTMDDPCQENVTVDCMNEIDDGTAKQAVSEGKRRDFNAIPNSLETHGEWLTVTHKKRQQKIRITCFIQGRNYFTFQHTNRQR
ncbi:unnamed protein product [Lupinus luteus]|uniref:Uncharacterized protein n=1 Tax=Lupinus luteus TaxID=3873 RepID=A0AAV1WK96_LUPLU